MANINTWFRNISAKIQQLNQAHWHANIYIYINILIIMRSGALKHERMEEDLVPPPVSSL